jgi:hypothetical protein
MTDKKRSRRELQLGEDLPAHELARLINKQLRHREHVLSHQDELPCADDDSVEYTEVPADYQHPTARPVRRLPRSRLRGARLPKQDN